MDHRIIIVDDETDFLQSIRRGLLISGYKHVETESDPLRAARLFEKGRPYNLALIDLNMPGMNGLDLLSVIRKCTPATECIMITAMDDARTAVSALKNGAYDYLIKPVDKDELVFTIQRALERQRLLKIADIVKSRETPALNHPDAFKRIVTRDPALLKLLKEAELHAMSNIPVLITGESGTGKELLARAVHQASPRANQVFIPVNMAALTDTLFDSEFFGHTKGAFTGAEKARVGHLGHASRGTLFLDEIGTLSTMLQGKLLRVIQEGDYIRLGTSTPDKTDVRFIAATNEDLDKLVKKNRFRKDMYYRLKGAWLHLPPLRKRKGDIPLLVDHFLRVSAGSGKILDIHEETLAVLSTYGFPGNVRELKTIMESAVNLAQAGPILPGHLPANLQVKNRPKKPQGPERSGPIATLSQIERQHILQVYGQMDKNKTRTAKVLGIALNTLRKKLDSYGGE